MKCGTEVTEVQRAAFLFKLNGTAVEFANFITFTMKLND